MSEMSDQLHEMYRDMVSPERQTERAEVKRLATKLENKKHRYGL